MGEIKLEAAKAYVDGYAEGLKEGVEALLYFLEPHATDVVRIQAELKAHLDGRVQQAKDAREIE